MKKPTDIFSVKDKVIIVTGGAGFLGSQYARALAEAGAKVIVWDVFLLKKKEALIEAMKVNITNESAVKKAVATVVKKYGHIDALINNAAMAAPVGGPQIKNQFAPYEDYPVDLWEKELKVNLTGTLICTKSVAAQMIKQKSGSIVNIASELSVIAHNHKLYNDPKGKRFKSIAYTTTKAALLGFTRQWAARLGAHNIRVNTFSPAGVKKENMAKDFMKRYGDTTMLGRMAHVDEYNGVLLFLCSDASAYMTGHNLIVDGGRTAW